MTNVWLEVLEKYGNMTWDVELSGAPPLKSYRFREWEAPGVARFEPSEPGIRHSFVDARQILCLIPHN